MLRVRSGFRILFPELEDYSWDLSLYFWPGTIFLERAVQLLSLSNYDPSNRLKSTKDKPHFKCFNSATRPIIGPSKPSWHTTSVFCVSESGYETWPLLEKRKLSCKHFSINSPYASFLSGTRQQERRRQTWKGLTYTKHSLMHTGKRTSITWATNARVIRRSFLSTYLVLWSYQP